MDHLEHKNPHQQRPQQQQHPKLKAFLLIQKYLALTGISSALLTQTYPVNGRILFGIFATSFSVICQLIYIQNDAETVADYIQSIYLFSLMIIIFFATIILIVKRAALYEYMNAVDELINIGKSPKWIIENRVKRWHSHIWCCLFRTKIFAIG